MIKSKSLVVVLVTSLLLAAFAGPAIVQDVFAQPQNPPTLSSKNEVAEPTPGQEDSESIPVDSATDWPLIGTESRNQINASWLWEQAPSALNTNFWISHEMPDQTSFSSYISDDFVVDQNWEIDTIYTPGGGWNGFTSLLNASSLNWRIYADNAGFPAGDPAGGGAAPVWSLSLPPTDPRVTISAGFGGNLSNLLLQLTEPIKLAPGHYWFTFYPTLNLTSFGQFGLLESDTVNIAVAKFINPGGGFGFGSAWQDWTNIGASSHDMAFSLGGFKGGQWKSIAPINNGGRSRPAAATVGGQIYLFGGETTGGGRADTVERYDPKTNTWSTMSGLMPFPASNICATPIGTDVYIPGGYTAGAAYLNQLQVYHTSTDTWSVITTDTMPQALYGVGCATLNNKLYVFGGSTVGGVPQSSAYVYDPAAPAHFRWATIAPMIYLRSFTAGVAVNGKIYAVGSGPVDQNQVEVYDPAVNLWYPVTSMNIARGGLGVYTVGNTIYACGGGWASYLNSCESYDTTQGYSGIWKMHPALMLQGRRTFAYANIGPTLYAVGGWNGGYLATAEKWAYQVFLPLVTKPLTNLAFNSQFNGNASGWVAAAGLWDVDASHLSTVGVPDKWNSIYYSTPSFKNLDYSVRMMRMGCSICASNLSIRGTPEIRNGDERWANVYMFQYSGDGSFSVWKEIGGVETALQLWTTSDAIKTGDVWNTLRVIASDTSLYFYINGTLVWTGTDSSLLEGKVGVAIYGQNVPSDKLLVDWATLYTSTGMMQIMDTVSPEQQALNDAANLLGTGKAETAGE